MVVLEDRVDSVSDHEHCDAFVLELLLKHFLDHAFGRLVDGARGFIHDHYLALSQKGSDDTDELAHAYTKILSVFFDFEVQHTVSFGSFSYDHPTFPFFLAFYIAAAISFIYS